MKNRMQNLESSILNLESRIKHLRKTVLTLVTVLGIFITFSQVLAVDIDILQPASTITYNEELIVNNTGRFNSVYIGKQGTGGVTFFNGTIINSTTGTGSSDNPVTFGDNVRIDGILFRTEEGGNNPIKLGDTLKPQTTATYDLGTEVNQFRNAYFSGTVLVGRLSGTGVVDSSNILDTTVGTSDLSDGAVSSAKIANGTITGSDISSSADLSVNTITTASNITIGGNITQNIDSYGAVKAAFTFNPDLSSPTHDGIVKRFGVEVSNVWPITTGVTQFTLDISVIDRYFSITPIVSTDNSYPYFCTGGVPIEDPVGYILEVRCYEPAGAPFYHSYVGATYNVLIY